MGTEPIRVAFLMADYGHDPTETAIPFQTFQQAGFTITFITETGRSPVCDERMISGWTGRLLGAAQPAINAYQEMIRSEPWRHPLAWSDGEVSLKDIDLLFLPGGHEKSVRQLLDSSRAQQLVADFWPLVKKPGTKACAAVCHGVQFLAHTKLDGQSVLHDVQTTALTGTMENAAFWSTRLVLGDYYKTYGAGTENVEDVVKKSLEDPDSQWKTAINPGKPFVVEDPTYNYLSGRWPGDAQALADKSVQLARNVRTRSV